MTIIKKAFIPAHVYNTFLTEDYVYSDKQITTKHTFVWEFNNTSDTINVKLTNTTNNIICYNYSIPYANIINNDAYVDQSLFSISDTAYNNFHWPVILDTVINTDATQTQKAVPYVVNSNDLIEVTSKTLQNKGNLDTGNTLDLSLKINSLGNSNTLFKILVPYVNCPVSELVFIVKVADNPLVDISFVNKDRSEVDVKTLSKGPNPSKYFNQLTITSDKSSPVAGDIINLTVTSENPNISKIYVEPVSGFTNKTQITLTNGVGKISINTFGFETADQIKVKFGYKYFSNIASYTKTLA